ncbi:hypothetical protein ACOSQ3_000352 [Xanthoceras sorbifolium]
MCSVLNADITLRFIVTMWLVWRSRNVLSHGGKCSMGEDLWVVAGDFLSSFQTLLSLREVFKNSAFMSMKAQLSYTRFSF